MINMPYLRLFVGDYSQEDTVLNDLSVCVCVSDYLLSSFPPSVVPFTVTHSILVT